MNPSQLHRASNTGEEDLLRQYHYRRRAGAGARRVEELLPAVQR
jgi:hypothetical protein